MWAPLSRPNDPGRDGGEAGLADGFDMLSNTLQRPALILFSRNPFARLPAFAILPLTCFFPPIHRISPGTVDFFSATPRGVRKNDSCRSDGRRTSRGSLHSQEEIHRPTDGCCMRVEDGAWRADQLDFRGTTMSRCSRPSCSMCAETRSSGASMAKNPPARNGRENSSRNSPTGIESV